MMKYKGSQQFNLEGFPLPFGGQLNPDNKWVKWSQIIPWDELAVGSYKALSQSAEDLRSLD